MWWPWQKAESHCGASSVPMNGYAHFLLLKDVPCISWIIHWLNKINFAEKRTSIAYLVCSWCCWRQTRKIKDGRLKCPLIFITSVISTNNKYSCYLKRKAEPTRLWVSLSSTASQVQKQGLCTYDSAQPSNCPILHNFVKFCWKGPMGKGCRSLIKIKKRLGKDKSLMSAVIQFPCQIKAEKKWAGTLDKTEGGLKYPEK